MFHPLFAMFHQPGARFPACDRAAEGIRTNFVVQIGKHSPGHRNVPILFPTREQLMADNTPDFPLPFRRASRHRNRGSIALAKKARNIRSRGGGWDGGEAHRGEYCDRARRRAAPDERDREPRRFVSSRRCQITVNPFRRDHQIGSVGRPDGCIHNGRLSPLSSVSGGTAKRQFLEKPGKREAQRSQHRRV